MNTQYAANGIRSDLGTTARDFHTSNDLAAFATICLVINESPCRLFVIYLPITVSIVMTKYYLHSVYFAALFVWISNYDGLSLISQCRCVKLMWRQQSLPHL